MTSVAPRRSTRLVLAVTLLLVVAVGVLVSLAGFSTTGYAGIRGPNLILEAFLQRTPTPIPTPVAAACGVRIAPRTALATDTVNIDLWNDGAAAAVRAMTLAWPAPNGDLVEIRFGGRTVWTGTVAGGSATVFPRTGEILPTIKPGEQTGLSIKFSGTAVEGQYIVLLHLGKSCFALFDSSLTQSQSQSCLATFDRFYVYEQEAILDVRNTTPEPLSLSRLLLFWHDNPASIIGVEFGDQGNVLSVASARSPLDITLPAVDALTLLPGQSSKVRLRFDRQAPLTGYSVALQAGNCQSVFSNVEPLSECPVRQEGELQVVGNTTGLILQNLGETDRPLDRIWLTFPGINGPLVDVTLNDLSIVDPSSGLFPKNMSPATMTAGVDLLSGVSLPANSRSTLAFLFQQNAGLEHYTVEVVLSDDCRVLSTTRTEEPAPCQMDVAGDTPLRPENDQLKLAIRNTGDVAANLQALQVDWLTQFNGALTGVALGDVPFWTGQRSEGTATVTHNTANSVPAIEPGASVDVVLTFTNPAVDAPYVLRLEFAEGCRLTYATQPDLGMPASVDFRGTIDQLPLNSFDGVWRIRLHADNLISVRVMPQTVIEPRELTPRVNDFVRVRVLPISADEFLAIQIRVTPNAPEPFSFSGLIEEVDQEQPARFIVVQGLTVDIVPETEIIGTLAVGWVAEVDGFRRADGASVLAGSIRTTPPDSEARRVDFGGVVEAWEQVSDTEAHWIVSEMRVVVFRDSTLLHGIGWGTQPEIGVEVQVAGNMIGARTVEAIELWYGPGTEIVEFSGFIRQLPNSSADVPFTGMWIVEDSAVGKCDLESDPAGDACKRVLVTESTFLDISEALPAIDAPVQVRAQRNPDGNLEGLWIKVFPGD